jgi:ABC-type bacteriocin/lantibiotic exporter with double-glycine peptidase domain
MTSVPPTEPEREEEEEKQPLREHELREAFGDVLSLLDEHFSMSTSTSKMSSLLGRFSNFSSKTWYDDGLNAIAGLDLMVAHVEASTRETMISLREGSGVWVTQFTRDNGERGWLILLNWARGGAEARLYRGNQRRAMHLTLPQVAEILRSDQSEVHDWLLVEPLLPLQALSMPNGHHHHDEDASARDAVRRLRALIGLERGSLGAIIVYSLVIGILTLITPITVQAMVNTIAFGAMLQPLIVLTLVLLVGLFFLGALRVIEYYVVEYIQRRLFVKLVTDLSHRLPRVDLDKQEKSFTPELLNRFFDIINIQKATSKILLDSLEIILQISIGMLVLAFYHPYLLAFDVVLVILILLTVFALGRGALKTSIHESSSKYEVAAWLEEIARHPLSFKSKSGMKVAAEHAELLATQYLEHRHSHFRIVLRQILAATITQALASAVLLGMGGWLVLKGQLTLGQLVAAELIVTSVAAGLAKLGKHLETYYDLVTGVYKVGHLLDLPLERSAGQLPLQRKEPYAIELEDLCVSRGSTAFTGVNLDIKAGEHIGIVGEDGAGKSALLDVIYGWRTPNKGMIRYDGIDLKRLSLEVLRDDVELVREADVLENTIDANIRLGRMTRSPEEVRSALDAVDLLDEFNRLEHGIDTRLVANGAPLSSDQLSRLMLARAILAKPKVLLLDGTLDRIRPERLQRALGALLCQTRDWTVIVISDRPEILARCDRVMELTAKGLQEVSPRTDGQP